MQVNRTKLKFMLSKGLNFNENNQIWLQNIVIMPLKQDRKMVAYLVDPLNKYQYIQAIL